MAGAAQITEEAAFDVQAYPLGFATGGVTSAALSTHFCCAACAPHTVQAKLQ